MKKSYGLALITHNNIERFKKSVSSIPFMDERPFIIINDGLPYDISDYRDDMIVLQHGRNKKISKTKNDALQYLLTHDIDWIFIMEDDMFIKDSSVFDKYIDVAENSGLLHLNFALHGDDNWNETREYPNPKLVYDSDVALYNNAGGCFQLFHRSIFDKVDIYDEYYKNCWEHLDLTFRITLAGYHTPFWLSADIVNSQNFIEQLDYKEQTNTSDYYVNDKYFEGLYYWKFKFGIWVADIPIWLEPIYHTDKIMEMFKEKRYNELSEIFYNYYKNENSPFFNKEYKHGHVWDNVYGATNDKNKLFIYSM
jgi:hypothetical protein